MNTIHLNQLLFMKQKLAYALLSGHLSTTVPGSQVSLCGFWLTDGSKQASLIQIVTISQRHCLRPHFSGLAVISMFLFGPVHGTRYM